MKYYIPTTSLNIDNILSTESISPLYFYQERQFGSKTFEKIPYNISEYSLYLFSEIPSFDLTRNNDAFEQYPIVIEFDDDSQLDGCSHNVIFECKNYKIISCPKTLYLTPWNSAILFFDKHAYNSSRIIIESSRNCKLGSKFLWKQATSKFTLKDMLSHIIVESPVQFKNCDYEINSVKGGLWGYILGKSKSISPDAAKLISLNNRMRNIISNTISNSGACSTNFYEQLLSFDTQYRKIADMEAYIHWNNECTENYKFVLEKFDVLKEAITKFFKLHNYNSAPEVPSKNCDKSYWISYRDKLALYTESYVKKNKVSSNIKLDSITFQKGTLSIYNFKIVNIILNFILQGKINKEALRITRIDVVKLVLSELSSIYKAEKGEDYWKESTERKFINALFYNIRDFEPFDINSTEDIELKSIAAFLLKGDDYDALIRYLQDNNFSDYSLVLTLWGTCEGYASLHKSLIIPIISPLLISEVYKIIGFNVNAGPFPMQNFITSKASRPLEPINDNSSTKFKDIPNSPNLKLDIYSRLATAKNGKKSLSKEIIKKVAYLYEECDYKANRIFYDKLHKISGVGKGAIKGIKEVLGNDDFVRNTDVINEHHYKPYSRNLTCSKNQDQINYLFTNSIQSTGIFLNDFEFLINNSEFVSIVSSIKKDWIKDLKWFIDAHKPENHKKYYKGKAKDNKTVIIQFTSLKKNLYKTVKDFLFRTYKINE